MYLEKTPKVRVACVVFQLHDVIYIYILYVHLDMIYRSLDTMIKSLNQNLLIGPYFCQHLA